MSSGTDGELRAAETDLFPKYVNEMWNFHIPSRGSVTLEQAPRKHTSYATEPPLLPRRGGSGSCALISSLRAGLTRRVHAGRTRGAAPAFPGERGVEIRALQKCHAGAVPPLSRACRAALRGRAEFTPRRRRPSTAAGADDRVGPSPSSTSGLPGGGRAERRGLPGQLRRRTPQASSERSRGGSEGGTKVEIM